MTVEFFLVDGAMNFVQMVSRSDQENDYRRWPENAGNGFNHAGRVGRGGGDYPCPQPGFGQQFADEFNQWRSGCTRPKEESRGKDGEKENPGKSK